MRIQGCLWIHHILRVEFSRCEDGIFHFLYQFLKETRTPHSTMNSKLASCRNFFGRQVANNSARVTPSQNS